MELKIGETLPKFKDLMSLLKAINEEMTLKFTPEKIMAASMDPSHVIMVMMEINKNLFQDYQAKEDETLTVNLKELSQFLDRIGKDESVAMKKDEKIMRLVITAAKGGHRRRFELPLLDTIEDTVPDPKIFFKAQTKILTKAFDSAIKDSILVAEHAAISIVNEFEKGAVFRIAGNGDLGDAVNEFEKGDDNIIEIKLEEDSSATYTLSYLEQIMGPIGRLYDVIEIELAKDMPMKIQGEGPDPHKSTIYLAPCIL